MALAGLINAFKRVSLIGDRCLKPVVSLGVIKPVASLGIINGSNVLKEFVRFVGRDNPFKYKKGRKSACYRRVVELPEKYTTRPLKFRKLGGRDPVTGRVVAATIGGGNKQRYRWIFPKRSLQKGEPDIIERVFCIRYDPIRSARIALIGYDDKKRWITATSNMKIGDLIRTSSEIPRIPVRPNEGDCYPLGALPLGTIVNSVEFWPNEGGYFAKAAGTSCQLLRKVGNRIIVQIPSKHEVSLDENCAGVVGRVSNVDHNKIKLGSAQKNRFLGNRPRSGLWHRKDGYCGRKIRPPPPLKIFNRKGRKPEIPIYQLSH